MFHNIAFIIIAFFAISSVLSLHPSPYDLFSNPITCSILYLCRHCYANDYSKRAVGC
ncbi:MAG: hypothetical protein LKKZDAJK_002866 [Candidatus Fervidibacter sp.]